MHPSSDYDLQFKISLAFRSTARRMESERAIVFSNKSFLGGLGIIWITVSAALLIVGLSDRYHFQLGLNLEWWAVGFLPFIAINRIYGVRVEIPRDGSPVRWDVRGLIRSLRYEIDQDDHVFRVAWLTQPKRHGSRTDPVVILDGTPNRYSRGPHSIIGLRVFLKTASARAHCAELAAACGIREDDEEPRYCLMSGLS